MSRSNNTEIVNPSTKFFQWSSDEKALRYFDKNKGEKGENVIEKIPFSFLVLDIFTTITGFNEKENSGMWSNEVKELDKQELTVRSKSGVIAKGLYKDIKPALEAANASYANSVYISFFNDQKQLVIGNIKFSGASLGAWFDFKKKAKIYDMAVVIDSYSTEKKGKNEYYVPTFKAKPVSDETNKKAIELDKELQEYMSKYFAKSNQPESQSSSRSEHEDGGIPPEQPEPAMPKNIGAEYESEDIQF